MDFRQFGELYRYNPATDLLGIGGFGRVYKAHDETLKRLVALKFFFGSQQENYPDGAQKYDLIHEIRRAIDFHHDNICRYFGAYVLESIDDFGQSREVQVGVMELMPGGTIQDFLLKHPGHRHKLLTDVLRGLSYLHQLEEPIIHRDLKPGNVLVALEKSGPVARITDFGISRSSNMSSGGMSIVGTYQYMAPEQFLPAKFGVNGEVRTNVDLWSYGVMLYQLLSGRLPFVGDDSHASTGKIMEGIVSGIPANTLEPFPEPYRSVLKRCLVLHAGERAQTADELIRILEGTPEIPPTRREIPPTQPVFPSTQPVFPSTPSVIPQKKRGPAEKMLLATALAGAAIIAGGVAYSFWHHRDSPQPAPIAAGTVSRPGPNNAAPGPKLASLAVHCNMPCTWTVNGRSAGSLVVGPDGAYQVPVANPAKIRARPADGSGTPQEKLTLLLMGRREDVSFTFPTPPPPNPPAGDSHPEIDALIESGYDRELKDDLPGAYSAYSNAEKKSAGTDKYRLNDAIKAKNDVLTNCKDREISCFGKQ